MSPNDLSNNAHPFGFAQEMEVGMGLARAHRISYVGELGWELHGPAEAMPDVYDALWTAGADHGIANYGSFAMNAMRMEKMFKGAGELTNEVTLPEADVMRFVRLDKDFVGKEATARFRDEGVDRKLVTLTVDTPMDVTLDEAVLVNDAAVGYITSGGYAHHVGRSMAMAYVATEHAAAGTVVKVEIMGEMYPAEVQGAPLYDPNGGRMRS